MQQDYIARPRGPGSHAIKQGVETILSVVAVGEAPMDQTVAVAMHAADRCNVHLAPWGSEQVGVDTARTQNGCAAAFEVGAKFGARHCGDHPMIETMAAQGVPLCHDSCGKPRLCLHFATDQKERCTNPDLSQKVEQRRCEGWIRSVIKGQCHARGARHSPDEAPGKQDMLEQTLGSISNQITHGVSLDRCKLRRRSRAIDIAEGTIDLRNVHPCTAMGMLHSS